MASSKKKAEIRQAPKHLDKILFSNYKEEERLQQKLTELTNNYRIRGIELDREKVQVHNEMRLSKRRNSSPTATPVVSLPTARTPRPAGRARTARPVGHRHRGSTGDTVNEYLLTEFRRVSEVIPSILSSLNKDEKADEEEEETRSGEGRARVRRATVAGTGASAVSSLTTSRVCLDPDLRALASKHSGKSESDPDISNIVSMIQSIKTLREDLALKKRYDLTKAKTSFNSLLRNVHEESRRGSDSDTYTDGACVLLRRKMHKARRASCPAMDLTTQQKGLETAATVHPKSGAATPQRRLSRCNTTLSSVGRQGSRSSLGMYAILQEEDRQLTQIKVDTELKRYDDIRMRIGHFLHKVEGPQRRRSLPVMMSSSSSRQLSKEET